MPVTREELYESVWSAPTGTAAAKYRVSGSFLARVCERLNVPRPPRGYWMKLKYGKAPPKPLLPPPKPGDALEWRRDWTAPARGGALFVWLTGGSKARPLAVRGASGAHSIVPPLGVGEIQSALIDGLCVASHARGLADPGREPVSMEAGISGHLAGLLPGDNRIRRRHPLCLHSHHWLLCEFQSLLQNLRPNRHNLVRHLVPGLLLNHFLSRLLCFS